MSFRKKGLGKGLNELLAATLHAPFVTTAAPVQAHDDEEELSTSLEEMLSTPLSVESSGQGEILRYLPAESLVPGAFQPRQHIRQEGLEQLSESIRTQGVVQPIVVRQRGERYEIVAGERRFRAAQMAGLTTIPAIVRQIPDETAMIMALIENIQREDLSALEEAHALKRLADNLQLTHLQIAEAIGKSRASVTNTLRLLTLNSDVQLLLEEGKIEMGHARALLALKGETQSQIAEKVHQKTLSVRETELLINQVLAGPLENSEHKDEGKALTLDPSIRRLEDELADKLGANVAIRHGAKGRGTVVIRYHNVDELEGILSHFR